jgi:hypothetical protein
VVDATLRPVRTPSATPRSHGRTSAWAVADDNPCASDIRQSVMLVTKSAGRLMFMRFETPPSTVTTSPVM